MDSFFPGKKQASVKSRYWKSDTCSRWRVVYFISCTLPTIEKTGLGYGSWKGKYIFLQPTRLVLRQCDFYEISHLGMVWVLTRWKAGQYAIYHLSQWQCVFILSTQGEARTVNVEKHYSQTNGFWQHFYFSLT